MEPMLGRCFRASSHGGSFSQARTGRPGRVQGVQGFLGLRAKVLGALGFRIEGFRVWGFRVLGLRFLGFTVLDFWFRVRLWYTEVLYNGFYEVSRTV